MATYKTPDVYVEEISIFPPSVAEVETAIPAFIGYTEKADKITTNDLNLIPTRISSLLEYETLYGKGPKPTITEVALDDSNNFKSVTLTNTYFEYDSVRLFYANGGGDCYIVSVGTYSDSPAVGDFTSGLTALAKFDEPTIILFPDASTLSANDLYGTLQPAALLQCATLGDRVAVFDMRQDDATGTTFRNTIPINNMKYGMAYTPWLSVSLQKNISYADVKSTIKKFGATTSLTVFTSDTKLQTLVGNYDSLLLNSATIKSDMDGLFGPDKTFRQKFETLVNDFVASPDETHFAKLPKLLFDAGEMVDGWEALSNADLAATIKSSIVATLSPIYSDLVSYDNEFKVALNGISGYSSQFTAANYSADWGTTFTNAVVATLFVNGDSQAVRMNKSLAALKTIFESINHEFLSILKAASDLENTYESALLASFPIYKNIITGINSSSTIMPPSGAVVGVYAATDRDRGVWKAPANVGLNSVVGPDTIFTNGELDALNIDVNAGKSINAIRAFTGKGTLIWGARTLAGNDNEWRYVPVRRFYNMVEESIKKSTYWAVFEPNSANTWVKVKGMIENYLTIKWKDGALAGAKPDEAFFVKVGLGITMTAQDVLEGRMNVEIGMAVVRPAEFIILKFSHKLQQS